MARHTRAVAAVAGDLCSVLSNHVVVTAVSYLVTQCHGTQCTRLASLGTAHMQCTDIQTKYIQCHDTVVSAESWLVQWLFNLYQVVCASKPSIVYKEGN